MQGVCQHLPSSLMKITTCFMPTEVVVTNRLKRCKSEPPTLALTTPLICSAKKRASVFFLIVVCGMLQQQSESLLDVKKDNDLTKPSVCRKILRDNIGAVGAVRNFASAWLQYHLPGNRSHTSASCWNPTRTVTGLHWIGLCDSPGHCFGGLHEQPWTI